MRSIPSILFMTTLIILQAGARETISATDAEAALSAEMRGKGHGPTDIDDKVAAIKADPARYMERAGATGQLAKRLLVAEEALCWIHSGPHSLRCCVAKPGSMGNSGESGPHCV